MILDNCKALPYYFYLLLIILLNLANRSHADSLYSYGPPNGKMAYYYAEDDLTEITIRDPLQPLNRKIDSFNYVVDGLVIKPVAQLYSSVVPSFMRHRVSSVLANISTTVSFGNFLIQGNMHNAMNQFWRFIFNSTLGMAGAFDVASRFNLQDKYTDGDLTYRHYCAQEGVYIVWPILGPASTRSSFGRVLDFFLSPMTFATKKEDVIYLTSSIIDKRAQLLEITQGVEAFSIDRYSINKSAFLQNRHYIYGNYQTDVANACGSVQLE